MAPSDNATTEQDAQSRDEATPQVTGMIPSVLVPDESAQTTQPRLIARSGVQTNEDRDSHLVRTLALLSHTPSSSSRSLIEAQRIAAGPPSVRGPRPLTENPRGERPVFAPRVVDDQNETNAELTRAIQDDSSVVIQDVEIHTGQETPRPEGPQMTPLIPARSQAQEDSDSEPEDMVGLGYNDYMIRIQASLERDRNRPQIRLERVTGNPADAVHNDRFNAEREVGGDDAYWRNQYAVASGWMDRSSNNQPEPVRMSRDNGAGFRHTLQHLARGVRMSRRDQRLNLVQQRSTQALPGPSLSGGADTPTSGDRSPRVRDTPQGSDRESRSRRANQAAAGSEEPRGTAPSEVPARREGELEVGDNILRREGTSSRPARSVAALRAIRSAQSIEARVEISSASSQASTGQSRSAEIATTPEDLLAGLPRRGGAGRRAEAGVAWTGVPTLAAYTEGIQRNEIFSMEDPVTPKIDAQLQLNRTSVAAINRLRYLTKLKDCGDGRVAAVILATELGMDSIADSLVNERVCDLPLRIGVLPVPESSSWLEPTMGWVGEQSGGVRNDIRSFLSGAGLSDDRRSQMLTVRALIHQVRRQDRVERRRRDLDWPGLSGLSHAEEDQVFADMESHLNQVVVTTNRADPEVTNFTTRGGVRAQQQTTSRTTVKEKWPVKVSLLSVDWKNMTLTGTMKAINIPDRSRSRAGTPEAETAENTASSSMESLFDGEIIDFRLHELETVAHKKGYTVGGPGIDVRYWAGVGPFKVAVDHAKQVRLDKKRSDILTKRQEDSSNDSDPNRSQDPVTTWLDPDDPRSAAYQVLTRDEEDEITDATMYSCLGGEEWIKDNMKEWILMRWKERCFVASSDSSTSTDSSRSEVHRDTSTYTPSHDATWGLTIKGFYYIALHRQTGRIEGLYYDPASQPLQRLEMYPKDLYGEGNARDVKKGEIRKEFPVFEFR